jgi:hypothetical protein
MGSSLTKVKNFAHGVIFKLYIKARRRFGSVPTKKKEYFSGTTPVNSPLRPNQDPFGWISPLRLPSPILKPPGTRRRGLIAKENHLGYMFRTEIQNFTEEERNELITLSPEIKEFLDLPFDAEGDEKSLNMLDEAAARFSDQTVVNILFANATAGERLIPHLPQERQSAVVEVFNQIIEWNSQIEESEGPSVVRRASTEIESCFIDHLDRLNDSEMGYIPTIYSNRIDNHVVVSNLPHECIALVRDHPASQFRLARGAEDGYFSVADASTVVFNHLTPSHFHELQAVQLTLAMAPSQ